VTGDTDDLSIDDCSHSDLHNEYVTTLGGGTQNATPNARDQRPGNSGAQRRY